MNRAINILLRVLVTLLSVLFIVTGVRWLVDPAGVAPTLGLTLENGVGLSTQIGDLASFFLVLGSCGLIGLISSQRIWFYPPIMLLGIAAVGRVLAWLVHDATLAANMIAPEIVAAVIFFIASRRLTDAGSDA